jgi:hypothetical protein
MKMKFKEFRELPIESLTIEERFALLGGCCLTIILFLVAFVVILIVENFSLRKELREERENHAPADTTVVTEETGDRRLSDWQVLLLGVAMTESEFYPTARGKNDDWGILQLTPIYVEEANRVTGEERWSHEDAWSVRESLEIFNAVQEHRNPEGDLSKAIRLHNKAPWYEGRVTDRMAFVRRYEAMRAEVVDYYGGQ